MKIKLKKKQIDSIHEEEFIFKNYNIIKNITSINLTTMVYVNLIKVLKSSKIKIFKKKIKYNRILLFKFLKHLWKLI